MMMIVMIVVVMMIVMMIGMVMIIVMKIVVKILEIPPAYLLTDHGVNGSNNVAEQRKTVEKLGKLSLLSLQVRKIRGAMG